MSATARKANETDAGWLQRGLRDQIAAGAPPLLCVAFSGGPDSTALLHVLAQLPEARERGLRALHVDHGLHPKSASWAEHCAKFCASLDVALTSVSVHVEDAHGEGIEAAARRARYAAFAGQLRDGEWLALAHHRDDQIETVLLKLLRGAGPEGLGGMRALRPFRRGFLWRPLLETSRETLRKYLINNELHSVSDPANDNPRYARYTLRKEILPQLREYWLHGETSILHAARLCRAAADYINDAARTALASLRRDAETLDVAGWLALHDALRAPALDAWLHEHGLPIPTDVARAELERQAAQSAEDRVPVIAWPGAEVRVWDGRLHAMHPLAPPPGDWQTAWTGMQLVLPQDCGTLLPETADRDLPSAGVAGFDPPLTVRFRRGGEKIKPADDPHTRELRDLFQRARIPPWVRERCPLLFAGEELIAVADLWVSERGKAVFEAAGARPHWTRPGCFTAGWADSGGCRLG
ncbi:MAG TPA: tRNA lysidine(34) synthetase TilS [Rhodanobacteraceae bacterium]|nr:tRNA lysidine(34) synthetase TilS [Rhodanobacteraceae bacterium]